MIQKQRIGAMDGSMAMRRKRTRMVEELEMGRFTVRSENLSRAKSNS